MDRTRLCEGRGPGSNPGEDTFCESTVTRRRSQTGRRPPAKRLCVGSTPTDVSLKASSVGAGRPAAQGVPRSVRSGIADWLSVFRTWVLKRSSPIPVSSAWKSTRLMIWLSRVRIPYQVALGHGQQDGGRSSRPLSNAEGGRTFVRSAQARRFDTNRKSAQAALSRGSAAGPGSMQRCPVGRGFRRNARSATARRRDR